MLLLFKGIIFLVVINLVATTCPENSVEWHSSCFTFFQTSVSFPLAEAKCYDLGGHLASIHDGFTNTLLASQAKKYVQGDEIWIGAVKYRDVTWNWTDNSNFDFTNWKTGDEKEDHDDCGVLQINYGYWLKDFSLNEKPFVCQTSSLETSSPPANPCKDKKWIYFEPTNSCYSISFVLNYNQSAAEDFCKTQGSHLVSLHSHEEAIFILDIESVLDYATWLGLKSDDQGVTWKWFDGTPTDYMPWLNGSPPNSPTQNTCATLIKNENGEPFMTGDYCGGEQPFICKKPVPN